MKRSRILRYAFFVLMAALCANGAAAAEPPDASGHPPAAPAASPKAPGGGMKFYYVYCADEKKMIGSYSGDLGTVKGRAAYHSKSEGHNAYVVEK